MSKYKVGDKFVIEIKEVLESKTGRGTLYRSDFSTLVFDDYGLDHLTKLPAEDETIRIGDEVTTITPYGVDRGIVIDEEDCDYHVLWRDKSTSWDMASVLSKTGKNFKHMLDELVNVLG